MPTDGDMQQAMWLGWKAAMNSRAQASAPDIDHSEDVLGMVNHAPDGDAVFWLWRSPHMAAADEDHNCTRDPSFAENIRLQGWEIFPVYTRSNAKAGDVRKAFAFDALVAAGHVTQAKADESLAIADKALSTHDKTKA